MALTWLMRRKFRGLSCPKHLADSVAEVSEDKRLGQDFHAGIQMAVPDEGVFGVAGDEQHFQVGSRLSRGVGDLSAVQTTRQTHVRDKKVDDGVGPQDGKAPGSILGVKHAIATVGEHFDQKQADRLLVINNQHGLALANLIASRGRAFVGRIERAGMARQIKAHCRALAGI